MNQYKITLHYPIIAYFMREPRRIERNELEVYTITAGNETQARHKLATKVAPGFEIVSVKSV